MLNAFGLLTQAADVDRHRGDAESARTVLAQVSRYADPADFQQRNVRVQTEYTVLMAESRPGKSGAVHRLPFECSGLAPRIIRYSVRSRSGTGIRSGWPKSNPLDACLGI